MKPEAPKAPDSKINSRVKKPGSVSFFVKHRSFLLSGSIHLALILSLLLSFKFSAKPVDFATGNKDTQAPVIIEATFIDSNVLAQKKREKQQAEADAAKRRRDIQRKKAADEKAAKAKRLKIAEDKKRKEEEQARKQRDLQEQAQLEKAKAEQERIDKEREDKLAKERAQQDKALQQQMEAEQADRNERRQRQILSELQIANGKIQARIEQNLIMTGSIVGKSCRLRLKIAANGFVLDATGSGDESLCLALRTAALKAGTLPMPADKDVNEQLRDTTLVWEN